MAPSCREVLAIRGETDLEARKPWRKVMVFVNKRTPERTSAHVKNLDGNVAPGGEPQTVLAKPDTIHCSLVVGLEHEADVERLGFERVIEREPIFAILPGINK